MPVQIAPVKSVIELIVEGYSFNKNKRVAEKTSTDNEKLEDGTFRDVTFKVIYWKDGQDERYILANVICLDEKASVLTGEKIMR